MKQLKEILTVMVGLHRELLDASLRKTEILKEGDVDEMQKVFAVERKLLRKIEQAEQTRMEIVSHLTETLGLDEEPTITKILEHVTDETERNSLADVTIELTETITELKAQEKLNLELLNQSMQFVQMSLDLLNPSLKNLNYSAKNQETKESSNRSIFDSKA